jgi:hypothetical protein
MNRSARRVGGASPAGTRPERHRTPGRRKTRRGAQCARSQPSDIVKLDRPGKQTFSNDIEPDLRRHRRDEQVLGAARSPHDRLRKPIDSSSKRSSLGPGSLRGSHEDERVRLGCPDRLAAIKPRSAGTNACSPHRSAAGWPLATATLP